MGVWQLCNAVLRERKHTVPFKKGGFGFRTDTQTPEMGTGSIINRDILSYHVTSIAEPCHFDTVPVPTSYPDPV